MELQNVQTKFSVGDSVYVVDHHDYAVLAGTVKRIRLEFGAGEAVITEEYTIARMGGHSEFEAEARNMFETCEEAFERIKEFIEEDE